MPNPFYFFLLTLYTAHATGEVPNVEYLHPGSAVLTDGRLRHLNIFCYKGKPKHIIHLWESVNMQLDHKSDNYVYYHGSTAEEVTEEYVQHRSSWSLDLFSWKHKRFNLDPFNQSCIGIHSTEKYSVKLNLIRIDFWKVLSLVAGVILFLTALKLSRNTFFHYLCGVTFGISASFLILTYFISKIFPKKPLMYGIMVGGWTLGVYFLQLLWDNLRAIMTVYQTYLLWYIIITGCLSFLVCYRFGPVTNPRTQNLIRWSLQALGLAAVLHSSQYREASAAQAVLLALAHSFPSTAPYCRRRWFPPRVRLLTDDEYCQEGVRHTARALEELRRHCASPDCNQWRTALRLRDVKRFASFIEGNSHITDNEILEYESQEEIPGDYTDDDEDNNALTEEEDEEP